MARSEAQEEVLRRTFEIVESGESLKVAFEAAGGPKAFGVKSGAHIYALVGGDEVLAQALFRARARAGQAIEDRITELMDDPTIDAKRLDSMSRILQWRASKANPAIYGDKMQVTQSVTIDLKQSLTDTQAALLEAPMIDVTPLKIGQS